MTTRDKIAAAVKLADAVSSYLNAKAVFPRSNTKLDAVLLALLSKSLRVARATAVLSAFDFGGEAFGLSRTMIDIAFAVRYITNRDSHARAGRYGDYFAKDYESWTKLIAKWMPTAQVHNPQHKEMLERAQEFSNPHSWTLNGEHAKEMAAELYVEPDGDGSATGWNFDYEADYKWTSHYVHATAPAVELHLPSGPLCAYRIDGGRERIPMADMALFNAAIYLAKICFRAFPLLGLPIQEIQSSIDAAIAAVRED